MANKERIQQLEKIIKSCIEAGVGFNEYKAELDGLRGQAPVSAPINTAALVKQAEANQAQAVAQAQETQNEVEFEDTIVDKGKWAESAKYVLNATGNSAASSSDISILPPINPSAGLSAKRKMSRCRNQTVGC